MGELLAKAVTVAVKEAILKQNEIQRLVNIIDGQAEVTISGKPFIVKKGEIIVMPANKPHSLKAVEKFKMLLVMIKK